MHKLTNADDAPGDDPAHLTALINRSPVIAIEWRNAPGWPVSFVSESIAQWGYERDDLLSGRLRYVRDNGVGFDMKYHDRVFEIFQRLYRAEDYPGTGIGLALVRKAVQRMGGRVWAKSAPGHGATFHVEFPQ